MTVKTVTLKNGSQEAEAVVRATMLHLLRLFDEDPTLAYEFVMITRDPNYALWNDAGEQLKRLHLLDQHGKVHDSVRNIVLSSVTGDEMNMVIESPIQQT